MDPNEQYGQYWNVETSVIRSAASTVWDLERIDCGDEWHSDSDWASESEGESSADEPVPAQDHEAGKCAI
jgi:hypothetical protein